MSLRIPEDMVIPKTIIKLIEKGDIDTATKSLRGYPECLFSANVLIVECNYHVIMRELLLVHNLKWTIIAEEKSYHTLHKYFNRIGHNFICMYNTEALLTKDHQHIDQSKFEFLWRVSPNIHFNTNIQKVYKQNISNKMPTSSLKFLDYIINHAPENYKKDLLLLLIYLLEKKLKTKPQITLMRKFYDFSTILDIHQSNIITILKHIDSNPLESLDYEKGIAARLDKLADGLDEKTFRQIVELATNRNNMSLFSRYFDFRSRRVVLAGCYMSLYPHNEQPLGETIGSIIQIASYSGLSKPNIETPFSGCELQKTELERLTSFLKEYNSTYLNNNMYVWPPMEILSTKTGDIWNELCGRNSKKRKLKKLKKLRKKDLLPRGTKLRIKGGCFTHNVRPRIQKYKNGIIKSEIIEQFIERLQNQTKT